MVNLIKMDLRRMLRSPMFFISLSVVAVLNVLLNVGITFLARIFAQGQTMNNSLSTVISTPFFLTFFIILMFASVVTFSYADIAGGFIKNIAGQLPNKNIYIISKFIVIAIHNIIYIFVSALFHLLGYLLLSGMGMLSLTNDGHIPEALLTLLLKWLLCTATSSILLFITNGIKNKVLASVVGVIVGTGSLGLAYMGLNTAISNIFHTNDFDLSFFMPDSLFNSVNVPTDTAVINAVVVSLVCIAIFLTLTVKVFSSRDVK